MTLIRGCVNVFSIKHQASSIKHQASSIALAASLSFFLVGCDDDEKNSVVDHPTILTAPTYIKNAALLESGILKIEAKNSGIQDADGVSNTVYKMVRLAKNCSSSSGTIFLPEKKYSSDNGVFEIQIDFPKSCGYEYYFYAEADVVVKRCSSYSTDANGKPVQNSGEYISSKRSYVIKITDKEADQILKSDPLSFGVNVPTKGC